MEKEYKFGGREYPDGKELILNDGNDSPRPHIVNKYSCFVTNYFCLSDVQVTNVQMLT